MPDVEQVLRELLTDDRLDVPVRADARATIHDGVRRRRRTRATVLAGATFSVVAIGLGATALGGGLGRNDAVQVGGENPPASATSPQPTAPATRAAHHARAAIPWTPIPYDASTPFALAGTTPDPSVPWCTAAQLTLSGGFQGSGGGLIGPLTVKNHGPQCGLQGVPTVVGLDAHAAAIARPEPPDPFLVHPWFALAPGARATTVVGVTALAARCVGPIDHLTVDLGHGGAALSLPAVRDGTGTRGVTVPHCGDGAQDHYSSTAGAWARPNGTPTLPMSEFSAAVESQPASVMQGTSLRFRVRLTTGGAAVDPCLPFREQLVAADGTVAATEDHLLDCGRLADVSSGAGYLFDMELQVPSAAAAGTYALVWKTPIPGLEADNTQSVRITAAPPACTQAQLHPTGRIIGAAGGAYKSVVTFTNTSTATCSLRGYPGVEFADYGAARLPTRPHHGGGALFPDVVKQTIVLPAHGGTASFAIGGPDFPQHGSTTPCTTPTGVRVIAPGLVQQVLITGIGRDCDRGRIDVSPVVAGTRGPVFTP